MSFLKIHFDPSRTKRFLLHVGHFGLQMDLVSSVDIVITGTYQGACPHSLAAAMATCSKGKSQSPAVTAADMAELNDAVETGLGSCAVLATAFCGTVYHIVWHAGAFEQNCITAGVATVERVLLAMTSHVENEVLQQDCARALAGLAYENPVNIAGMLALGAPDTLFVSADTHIASGIVQDKVCWALYRILCSSADGKTALRASRAADMATRAKDLYPDLFWPDVLLRTLSAE